MGHAGQKTALKSNEGGITRFVARQPILEADEKIVGYELLFRDGIEDYFRNTDAEAASRSTLDTSMLLGLDVLCDGRRAFINCTRDMLLKGYMTLLPAQQSAIEVLESVQPDELVINACSELRKAGYWIVLDGFQMNDPREPLAGLADIIKVDFRQTSVEQASALVSRYGTSCRMLAEKVETRDEFAAAKKAGFTYFQGYFFCRPAMMQARDIPANRVNYLRLLQAISKEEMEPQEVENVIKSEASLCYRLLRYLNSPIFGFINDIQSVRHALAILGEREVRRWIRLVATLTAGQGKSRELVLSAMVRARFCELLSPHVKHGSSDLFLVGMLSLMDSILELPMHTILENLPIDPEAKALLLGQNSPLRPLFQLMLAQEHGDWEQVHNLSAEIGLRESLVAESYWQAMQWAKQVNSGA
jgi:c-di-GMP-related signal transduction protein